MFRAHHRILPQWSTENNKKLKNSLPFDQGYTNPRHQVAMVTKCFKVVAEVYGSSVWNILHVTILVPILN